MTEASNFLGSIETCANVFHASYYLHICVIFTRFATFQWNCELRRFIQIVQLEGLRERIYSYYKTIIYLTVVYLTSVSSIGTEGSQGSLSLLLNKPWAFEQLRLCHTLFRNNFRNIDGSVNVGVGIIQSLAVFDL